MPIAINSPARNLFLLGSAGGQVVTNFFRKIQQPTSDDYYQPEPASIAYDDSDENYIISGDAETGSITGPRYGWIEKRQEDGTAVWDTINRDTTGGNVLISAMELKGNDLIVAGTQGFSGGGSWTPWIAKYTNGGVVDWQSTTNTGDLEYTGIAIDNSNNYYACGNTKYNTSSGDSQAFVEQFDASGNPGWGKSAFMLGRDIIMTGIDANSRGHVVAVGYLEDDRVDKGYIVKIDTTTGEVLWDRTIESFLEIAPTALGGPHFRCNDVHIDSSDNIYVIGTTEEVDEGFPKSVGHVIKYSPEGNIIWQKETDYSNFGLFELSKVEADDQTGNVVVFGRLITDIDSVFKTTIVVSKYNRKGDLVFRRSIINSDTSLAYGLDSDPSYYYLLFTTTLGNNDAYTYGKVSSSGNGLGDFEYFDGQGNTIDYKIVDIEDRIGRLSDGSLQNNSSDLITYPFNGTKIIFDDLATQVSNKKRQMDSADSFEYSGSPAIRPADFQELNLLGDVDPTNELNTIEVSSEIKITPADSDNGDDFGYSVAVGNNKIVASAPGDDDDGDSSGSIYIFDLDGTNQIKVTASDAAAQDIFGREVAVGNNKIVVGSYGDDDNGASSGSVYVYDMDGSNELKITPSDGAADDNFGIALAVGDNKIVVGAPRNDDPSNSGCVYVYNLDGTGEVKITASDASNNQFFGGKVAIGNNKIAVGTLNDEVYVYNLDGTGEVKITPSDPGSGIPGDQFGNVFAIGNNKIFIGASNDDDNGSDSGTVYVYNLDGTGEQKINPSDAAANDQFGISIAVGNDKIIIGNTNEAVYVYDIDDFSNELKITASDPGGNDNFGSSVAVGDNKIVVGAYFVDANNTNQVGAIYIYPIVYSATSADQSGKGNDGVVSGATHNADGYWEFSGTDNHIISGPKCNTLFEDGGSGTIEMWVRPQLAGARQTLCSGYMTTGSTQPDRWDFEIRNTNRLGGGSHDNSFFTGTTDLSTNTWYHFVFTLDKSSGNGTLKAYINAVEEVTQNFTLDRDWATDIEFGIGNRYLQQSDFPLNADVGEVRTYPRALTPAQVFQNYNSTKSKYINEAPDIAPKIGPGIVYGSDLLLNYDFKNQATYDTRQVLPTQPASISSTEQKITSSDNAGNDYFGHRVAVKYNKIFISAYGDNSQTGALYVYDLDGSNELKITPSDGAANDYFGYSLAVGDNKIVVGAWQHNSSAGAVYVYDLDGTNEVKITASDGAANDYFGYSLAVGDNKIVVGAYGDDVNGTNSGSVYVYDLDGTNQVKITASDGAAIDYFGFTVAVGSGKIVVGAPSDDNDNGSNSGSVYVYDLDGSNEVKITTSDGADNDYLGFGSVAIGNDKIAVGAYLADAPGSNSGALYVYDLDGTNELKITASDGGDNFGYSITIESSKIYVGVPYDGSNVGAIYLYDLDGNELTKITASDSSVNQYFGFSVAVGSGKIVVGAYGDNDNGSNSGSAYIYSLFSPPTTVKNLSSSSYTGTINGSTFNSAGYFEFDGVDDRLSNFDVLLSQTNGWTCELWFRGPDPVNDNTASTWNYLFTDAEPGGPFWECGMYSNGLTWTMKDNTIPSNQTAVEFSLTQNQWHYLAFGLTSTGETFLTGSDASGNLSTDLPGVAATSGACRVVSLFSSSANNNFLAGHCGEIRLYDKELTLAERTQNFNATRGKYGV